MGGVYTGGESSVASRGKKGWRMMRMKVYVCYERRPTTVSGELEGPKLGGEGVELVCDGGEDGVLVRDAVEREAVAVAAAGDDGAVRGHVDARDGEAVGADGAEERVGARGAEVPDLERAVGAARRGSPGASSATS